MDQFDSINLTELQTIDLGIAGYYCEIHEYSKDLEGITGLLAKVTELRSLNINGAFLLSKPLNYRNLISLDIFLENFDTCQNSRAVTDQALDYLISGNTLELDVLIIDF